MADEQPELKRARTEDPQETTKNEPEYVYIVSRTDFNDDYKPRGGDWSSEEFLGVFRTLESATRKMKEDQVEMIIEEFECECDDDDELVEKYVKSRTAQFNHVEWDKEAIMKDLDSLTETVFAGEFVNVKCDWSLVKQEVQD
jgi:hypothetical protein